MKKQMEQLAEFHKAFGVEKPEVINDTFLALRNSLLEEEVEEFTKALGFLSGYLRGYNMPAFLGTEERKKQCEDKIKHYKVEMLDALADIIYIACGTAQLMGMDLAEAFERVHKSNMDKLDENGKPIINGENGVLDESKPLGKVLKRKGWKSPVLDDLV